MELWIRSQDKECLMKVDRLDIDYTNGIYKIKEGGFNTLLAEYSSKERALEVLDEIQDLIKEYYDSIDYRIIPIYEMPKE